MNLFDTRPPALVLTAMLLTACGGGSDKDIETAGGDAGNNGDNTAGAGDQSGLQSKRLPAANETVYLNLKTGALVGENDEWHIAANRLRFTLNGGASGSGMVGGVLAVAQDDFYDADGEPRVSVFTNATVNSEEEHLREVFSAPESWQQDAFASAFGASSTWSEYDRATGVISEKADVGYLVRSAEGDSYARMRVVDFHFPTRAGSGIESFRFEFEVQAAGASQFSNTPVVFEAPADYDGMDACFDFDSAMVVDCAASDAWDLLVGFSGRDWYLRSNSGESGAGRGGASAPMTWSELDQNAADPGVPRLYESDATGGVFSENTWYAYNLSEQHRIWPNFRTFLVKSDVGVADSATWALQITGYYDDNGNSGQPSVRWVPVELEQPQE
ncbi:HmuY family protein [Marinobacter daepoensis]|uniref:HmuY family protein n=1 Tax=Marinobacter daepoensis TaxID=262077 RepID=UPI000420B656|nr:HmuY family protein [Marinobacter daepoensis]MBY6033122.1 HmuY family protein [Marinobacter daepoensis]